MAELPPRIARGQTIGVCAPAGPVLPDRLAAGLTRLSDHFAIKLAPSLRGDAPSEDGVPSYLSASDDRRASELSALLADRDVRAIVLARGGYGIMRILDRLDPELVRRDPKPIVGFSDATALLGWAYAAGVRGIHGPMVTQLGALPAEDCARLIAALTDPAPLPPWPVICHGPSGTLRGPLVAANLTLATVMTGTPWPLPLARSIALFEEVGERPYAIDRYLTQLTLAGELAKPIAFVVGDLTRCEDDPPASVRSSAALAVVIERCAAVGKRVASGAPVGHGERNQAVGFAGRCELDLDGGMLSFGEGAVA